MNKMTYAVLIVAGLIIYAVIMVVLIAVIIRCGKPKKANEPAPSANGTSSEEK